MFFPSKFSAVTLHAHATFSIPLQIEMFGEKFYSGIFCNSENAYAFLNILPVMLKNWVIFQKVICNARSAPRFFRINSLLMLRNRREYVQFLAEQH